MARYRLRVALALRTPDWVFHTVRSGIDPGDHRLGLRFVGVIGVWKDSDPDGTLSSPGGAGSVNPRLGFPRFRTVRGGIDKRDHRFCPRFVRVVDVSKDY